MVMLSSDVREQMLLAVFPRRMMCGLLVSPIQVVEQVPTHLFSYPFFGRNRLIGLLSFEQLLGMFPESWLEHAMHSWHTQVLVSPTACYMLTSHFRYLFYFSSNKNLIELRHIKLSLDLM